MALQMALNRTHLPHRGTSHTTRSGVCSSKRRSSSSSPEDTTGGGGGGLPVCSCLQWYMCRLIFGFCLFCRMT